MPAHDFVSPDSIRAQFSAAMSLMYKQEVPLYGTLLELVSEINQQVMAQQPKVAEALRWTGEIERLDQERHGAIRVGTAQELATIGRLFAVMGMHPVGYYDLSVAGVPVHSTAFRPRTAKALAHNPFRVFTSLLRLELIEDPALREQAAQILARRRIFTDAAHIAPVTGHGRQDQRRAERQCLWPPERAQHPVKQHHAEQPGERRGQAHGPGRAAKQADRAGVEPQAQGRFLQERCAEQTRRDPVIIQVHFHGDPGDPGFSGTLQLVVAQGEEEQQAGQQEQQRSGS